MKNVVKYFFPFISIVGAISFLDIFLTMFFRPKTISGFLLIIEFFGHNFAANSMALLIIVCLVVPCIYILRKFFKSRFFDKLGLLDSSLVVSGVFLLTFLITIHINDALNEPFTSLLRLLINVAILVASIAFMWGNLSLVGMLSRRTKLAIWRYTFIALSILSLTLLCSGYFVTASRSPKAESDTTGKPNVLIITVDALRKDRLSCYSNTYVDTPYIDKFASKSLILDDFHTHAPWTLPSMFTMLTSSYPSVHGINDYNSVGHENLTTLTELMGKNGYDTEAYIANNIMDDELGFNRGFQKYVMFKDIPEIMFISKSTIYYAFQYIRMNASEEGHADSSEWLNEQLIQRLEKRRKNPFFIWAHYLDPHQPLTPPLEYIEGDPEQIENAVAYIGRQQPFVEPSNADPAIRLYDAESKYVDDMLKSIFNTIDSLGLYDNTMIILTSDHGEEHFEHGRYGHGENHYKHLMNIPCIIYYPGVEHRRSSATASLIDIMPTILSYVECDYDVNVEGKDFLGSFDGNSDGNVEERPVFYEGSNNAESLYIKPYTLIHWNKKILPYKDEYELIDNRKDKAPGDIVSNPDSELLHYYKTLLLEHRNDCSEKAKELGKTRKITLDENQEDALKDLGYF